MDFLPADSFPITKVSGVDCWIGLLRAVLAAARNELRDVRGRGILNSMRYLAFLGGDFEKVSQSRQRRVPRCQPFSSRTFVS